MGSFKNIHRMDEDYMFSGLNYKGIEFIRQEGMWLPINDEVLEIDKELETTDDFIYTSYKDKDFLMFIIVEKGEFLLGKVYDLLDNYGFSNIMLHEYILVDGTMVREQEQITIDDNVFLCLVNSSDNKVIIEWSEEEIEEYLDFLGNQY